MKRIFWGMLLIMIDLTIMNGVFYLDLLPDFLGVLLCLWGMAQLDDVWHESRIRGFLCFYAFYTVADLLIGMYGIIFSPITMSLMPVLSNIMTLYLAAELTGMIRQTKHFLRLFPELHNIFGIFFPNCIDTPLDLCYNC